MDINLEELIESRFFARKDAFAVQNEDGKGYQKYDLPIGPEIIRRHLAGDLTLGAYQLNSDGKVLWLVFDFDTELADRDAQALLSIVMETEYAHSTILEATGNGSRRHLWILFSDPVSAVYARSLAKGFLQQVKIVVEIFPKQTSVADDGYGNLVKIPFGVNRKTGNRSTLLFPSNLEAVRPFHVSSDAVAEVELKNQLQKQHFTSMMRRRARYCISDISNNPVDDAGQDRFARRRNIIGHVLARAIRAEAPSISIDMVGGALMTWNLGLKKQLPQWELESLVRGSFEHDYPFGCSTIRDNPMTAEFCKPELCPWGLQFLDGMDAAKWLANFGVDRIREWNKKVGETLIGKVIKLRDMGDKGIEAIVLDQEAPHAWKISIWKKGTIFNDNLELFRVYKFNVEQLDRKVLLITLVS